MRIRDRKNSNPGPGMNGINLLSQKTTKKHHKNFKLRLINKNLQGSTPKTTKLILLDSLLQEAEHVARLYFQIAG
jgi:hypothetical protein